jgi:2-phospho-L-lactate/phosphoenolpyruvate guanylyltransferase
MSRPETAWTVVLPLKGGTNAKSRLGAPAQLATAIALDCLAAVLAADDVGDVVVVTPDPRLAGLARDAGARVRPESVPGSGLLAAVSDGLAGVAGRCAVLLADLPALRPADLTTALRLAAALLEPRTAARLEPSAGRRTESAQPARPEMVFLPDAEGSGTVLLTALDPAAMRPAFGPASASAHEAAGAHRLDADLPRLRRDVDTRDDLRTALALGVGVRTQAALAVLSPSWPELVDNRA